MAHEIGEHLRVEVARRADRRCEYCLIHEEDTGFTHQVDHIFSQKHGGLSTLDNLAFACILCNRYKGTDIASAVPLTGEIRRLFHPRNDRWSEHFRFREEFIESITDVGSVTVRLLRLNSSERLSERRLLQRLGRYPVPQNLD